jgi:hypothetical protein
MPICQWKMKGSFSFVIEITDRKVKQMKTTGNLYGQINCFEVHSIVVKNSVGLECSPFCETLTLHSTAWVTYPTVPVPSALRPLSQALSVPPMMTVQPQQAAATAL